MNDTTVFSVFVGSRLKEARLAMGLPLTGLADAVGTSTNTLRSYEDENKTPKPEYFTQICRVLGQSPAYFYHPDDETDFSFDAVHFRARTSFGERSREQVGMRLKWLMEYYSLLAGQLELPKVNFPEMSIPSDPSLISQELIEDAVSQLRSRWSLGDQPIKNFIRVAERNGFVIGQVTLDFPKLDGLSLWGKAKNRPFILLNTDKASYVRSRFDLGHEIGHMILHKEVIEDVRKGTSMYNLMEKQAHYFASALLLPEESWVREVKKFSLAVFKILKPRWRASISAMIMRAFNLGYISKDQRTSLMKQMSSMGWKTREPFDDLWELETPRLFQQATEMLERGNVTGQVISQRLPLRSDHLSEITRMPKDFFDTEKLLIHNNSGVFN